MEEYVGKLVIGTDVNNKQLEKKLNEQKKELEKHEKEAEELLELKAQYETDVSAFEEEQKQIAKTREEYNKLNAKIKEIEAERSRISELPESQMKQAYAENPELSTGYFQLLKERSKYNQELLASSIKNEGSIEEQKRLLTEVNQKLEENVKSQEQIRQNISLANAELQKKTVFDGINNSINKIGKSMSDLVKKVARWGLAIFGIRGAYMAVRNAINVISQDDEQLKADIDYIKTALAYTLEPVVRGIVNLVKQMLVYIGWIIKQWTGKNIFENANKSLKKSVGSAKDLKKQLASFDEMNVLQDTSSSGGGGASPTIDLANGIDDLEPPEWLTKIKEIGQWIIDNWQDVVFALLLTKLFIDLLTGNWIGVIIDFIGLLIIAFLKIKDAFKVIWESAVEIWGKIKEWLLEKITEILIKWFEFRDKVIAIWQEIKDKVKEIWQSIINWIVEKWTNFTNWISNIITKIGNFFSNLWQGVKNGVKTAVDWIKDKFNSIVTFFSNIISRITGLFKTIGTNVGNVLGGAFKGVINGVLRAIENILNSPIRAINSLINTINEVPGINIRRLGTFSLPRLAKGGIVNNPGPGVMMGSYIAGEKGPEAVIPLDDATLDRLGLAFARHTTINATIPVYAYNREVDRQMRRIQAEDNFASNR